jgi:hypothetical protein
MELVKRINDRENIITEQSNVGERFFGLQTGTTTLVTGVQSLGGGHVAAAVDDLAEVGHAPQAGTGAGWSTGVSVPYRLDTPTYKPQVKIFIGRASTHCHMSYGSGPHLLTEVSSGVATYPMALDLTSRLR